MNRARNPLSRRTIPSGTRSDNISLRNTPLAPAPAAVGGSGRCVWCTAGDDLAWGEENSTPIRFGAFHTTWQERACVSPSEPAAFVRFVPKRPLRATGVVVIAIGSSIDRPRDRLRSKQHLPHPLRAPSCARSLVNVAYDTKAENRQAHSRFDGAAMGRAQMDRTTVPSSECGWSALGQN